MWSMFTSICDKIEKLINIILALLIASLVIIMVLAVLFRYVLKDSIVWVEQVTGILFVWSTFLGTTILYRKGLHISLDYFLNKIPQKLRSIINIINEILMLILFVFLTIYGINFALANLPQTTGALNITPSYFYFAAPVSAVILIVFWIENNLVLKLKNKKST